MKEDASDQATALPAVPTDATATTTDDAPVQPPASQWQLLQQLNASFDYEGRLPLMPLSDSDKDNSYRCGFVSIIGAPNMGKSTLLNALLQENLSICTARPQTTRHAILGLVTTNTTQVCLIDTPGAMASPAYKLQEGMMEAVITAVRDADVLLVVTDPYMTPIPNDALFAKVQRSTKPVIVVINKIDLAAQTSSTKQRIEPLAADSEVPTLSSAPTRSSSSVAEAVAQWRQLVPQAVAILPVAASRGSQEPGVVALRRILCGSGHGPDLPAALRALGRPIPGMFLLPKDESMDQSTMYQDDRKELVLLPRSPPLFDRDALTDRTERFVASEIIRAALFETLSKELPYCCEVQITEFKEPPTITTTADLSHGGSQKQPITRISANVIVERDSQKSIVIGKNGVQIKQVGVIARTKLQDFLQTQVRRNRMALVYRYLFI
jgi:GTPase